jgi:ribosomal protein S18 acetylase RimI-like enzyme
MTSEKIVYKTNQAKDSNILKHLKSCNDHFVPPLDQKVNIKDYSQKLFENANTFEAWYENDLIGLVAAYSDGIKKRMFITNVSVTEQFSNQGIASALLEICVQYTQDKQLQEIILEVNQKNKKAIRLYAKLNFEEIGLDNGFLLMRLEI